jgi:hypothetical protein
MQIDRNLLFCEDLAVTVSALLTTKPDLLVARDVGKSKDLFLVVLVTEAFTAAGAATLDLAIQSDDNSGFASGTDLQKITPAAIPKASLTLGKKYVVKLQPGAYERYIGINATVATGPFTAGKLTAFFTNKPADWVALADPL